MFIKNIREIDSEKKIKYHLKIIDLMMSNLTDIDELVEKLEPKPFNLKFINKQGIKQHNILFKN